MNRSPKKIGFIYFEEIHHIPHFIGIASELAKHYKDYEVNIITYKGNHTYLYKLIKLLEAKNLKVVHLNPPVTRLIIDFFSGRKKPSAVYLYKKHKKFLLHFDALIFTEKNHKYLHTFRKKSKTPYLISVGHGPGGRGYAFQPSLRLFDFMLLCGDFYLDRLQKESLLIPNYAITGYSKFDVVRKENRNQKLFNNGKPTVLYNPHFNKINSSWYTIGNSVLEYFYNQEEFNLIFAPHIYLFNRKGFLKPDSIDKKFFEKENIFIDLGSIRSSNMTYILNSDVYLGDVSSQVYEYIIKPRPAIFIDVENVDWQNNINYRFWKMGVVVRSMEELKKVLQNILPSKLEFLEIQKIIFKENYHIDSTKNASQKGAQEIDAFLNNNTL
jgi:hypothetical protein